MLGHYSRKAAQIWLLVASLVFYSYNRPSYLLIIVSSIVFNYALTRIMDRTEKAVYRKILLAIGLVFNIGLIGYYKYFNFIKWNINHFLDLDLFINNIVLPLGISFYTIQQISFVIDAYKRENVDYNFLEYALYVSFFPQLVAGPIVYHSEFVPQLHDKIRIDYENLTRGLIWFSLGLSKKVFSADRLGRAVEWGYTDISRLTSLEAWLVILSYTFQIYFDFSGYSDMARGIGLLFNIKLPQNFNSPYKSLSIRDFWKRWHMTLTRFLTKYIYIPLGGSRCSTLRIIFNTMVVFIVSGVWHGANYTFILWGIIHGALMLVNRFTGNIWEKVPVAIRWGSNFTIVSLLWALFRADGVRQWISLVGKLFAFDSARISSEVMGCFDSYLPWWILLMTSLLISLLPENNYNREITVSRRSAIVGAVLMVLCLFTLNRTSIFLYFNF
jgi:alginate O-acetyltransferase complex protein AlgI